jgi:Neuraminidase (sialidase)
MKKTRATLGLIMLLLFGFTFNSVGQTDSIPRSFTNKDIRHLLRYGTNGNYFNRAIWSVCTNLGDTTWPTKIVIQYADSGRCPAYQEGCTSIYYFYKFKRKKLRIWRFKNACGLKSRSIRNVSLKYRVFIRDDKIILYVPGVARYKIIDIQKEYGNSKLSLTFQLDSYSIYKR